LINLLFGHKNKLQIDLGDLESEKEHLLTFLETHLKTSIASSHSKLILDSEKLTSQELKHIVTKFVYKRNLNSTHWVSQDGETIKINKFKGVQTKQPEKKKTAPHKSITQSWGL
jgi:hypothetical protein